MRHVYSLEQHNACKPLQKYRRLENFRVKNIWCVIFCCVKFYNTAHQRKCFWCVRNGDVRASVLRLRRPHLPVHLVCCYGRTSFLWKRATRDWYTVVVKKDEEAIGHLIYTGRCCAFVLYSWGETLPRFFCWNTVTSPSSSPLSSWDALSSVVTVDVVLLAVFYGQLTNHSLELAGKIVCSCCDAIVSGVPICLKGFSSYTGCASSQFHFVNSSTSRFTEAIAHEGTESDSNPLGSGSPSMRTQSVSSSWRGHCQGAAAEVDAIRVQFGLTTWN